MSKAFKLFFAVVVLPLVVTVGCAHMPGGIAPSSTPLEGKTYVELGEATGTDSAVYLFGLIPITGSNTTPDALSDALASSNGDALINVTVESYCQYFFIVSRVVTTVHGNAIKFQK
ncbi:MAG TPA: hypothetical protein ENG35_05925 [Desulfobacteraceae bacterium]|nr:MAG: hypothetical protein B1H13_14320 [Desulfobacteraceae bacterium 4484_190.3]HDL08260.1 hypothetical protein [Desulfobacteraceae bacterium]